MDQQKRVDKLPIYKTAMWTFVYSLEVLAKAATKRLDVPEGERMLDKWTRRIFESGDATLVVEGAERLSPGRPYVILSNHTSLLDIPSIFRAVPGPVRMVAKSELKKIPFFGPAMDKMGIIFIDRGDRVRAMHQLDAAREKLAQGISVWIAPEGTRSRDGALGPFKRGGFHLALSLGVPIVPTWIEGAADCIPPDSFDCTYGGRVVVRFGEPIDTTSYGKDDLPALMAEVRQALLRLGGPGAKDGAPLSTARGREAGARGGGSSSGSGDDDDEPAAAGDSDASAA